MTKGVIANTAGRKNKWDELEMDNKLILVEGWCRDGATDKEIMEYLGISHETFYRWKKERNEFSDTLKRGKEIVDRQVENSLLKRALGFKEIVKKAIKIKNIEYDKGKKIREIEEVVLVDEEVYIQPDVTAQIFWLKNRKPQEWRDKKDINMNASVKKLEDYFLE